MKWTIEQARDECVELCRIVHGLLCDYLLPDSNVTSDELVSNIIEWFDNEDTVDIFTKLGIMKEDEGR